jgi:hypothetical protein
MRTDLLLGKRPRRILVVRKAVESAKPPFHTANDSYSGELWEWAVIPPKANHTRD